ncbi:MAG: NUDIX domain-containing protein, partial [Saprospiraceae bacterium]|nr:NUDIX domain-containing protein [Saprospiraceae bacterium]
MPNKHKLVPAVHLFIFNNTGQLLMARRYNTGYEDGNYSVVAGHVEEHETVLEAARREAKEEVGIGIAVEDFRFVHVMHRRREKQHLPDRVDFFVSAHKWTGALKNME